MEDNSVNSTTDQNLTTKVVTDEVTNNCGTLIISPNNVICSNEWDQGFHNQKSYPITVNTSSTSSTSSTFTIGYGGDSVTYYVTMYDPESYQIKNLAFKFNYCGKIPSDIISLLKAKIESYKDSNGGKWVTIGPIVVWTNLLGYVPIIVPEFYETVKFDV